MNMVNALGLALAAGLSIPAGAAMASSAALARFCRQNEIDSFVAYFGGGALLAAIALVLLPDGMANAPHMVAIVSFMAGGVLAWRLSAWMRRSGGSAANFVGMMLDYVPEAIVLGAAMAQQNDIALLLAGLIALQNLPEGFAAYHEMTEAGVPLKRRWALLGAAPLAGPVAAWVGFSCINMGGSFMAGIMLFCSGAILYLIFQSIAPGAHLAHRDFPALGAVSGFLMGMAGTMLVH